MLGQNLLAIKHYDVFQYCMPIYLNSILRLMNLDLRNLIFEDLFLGSYIKEENSCVRILQKRNVSSNISMFVDTDSKIDIVHLDPHV